MVDGGTETNITVTYDDTGGKLNFVASGGSVPANLTATTLDVDVVFVLLVVLLLILSLEMELVEDSVLDITSLQMVLLHIVLQGLVKETLWEILLFT